MFSSWFADHNITKPDHSIVGCCWYSASDANQQAKPELWKCGPHLGNDSSGKVVAWRMQPCNDNIMASDTTQGIDVVVGGRLWQGFVLLVQHLQCSDQLHFQRTDPSDSVITVFQFCLGCARNDSLAILRS